MLRQMWILAPPADGEAAHGADRIVALLKEVPGVLKLESGVVATRSTGEVRVGSVVDVYFLDEDAMNAAYASVEGKRVSREVMSNPAALVEVLTITSVDT